MTPCAFTIRHAVLADAPEVLRLYACSGIDAPGETKNADPAGTDPLWQRLHAAGGVVLLAERAGRAVGTLTLFVLPLLAHGGLPSCVVEDVAVDPTAQGLGLGRALMHAAMQHAQAAGCYKLALSSNLKREAAHAFYDHLGMQRHGISFVVMLNDTTAAPVASSPAAASSAAVAQAPLP